MQELAREAQTPAAYHESSSSSIIHPTALISDSTSSATVFTCNSNSLHNHTDGGASSQGLKRRTRGQRGSFKLYSGPATGKKA